MAARAQVYPSRPVTIVVPFPAGGPTDTLARILTEHIRTLLGQSVIIENVSGAGGSIESHAQRLMGTPLASVTGEHMF
jgi:tripartite-type tricarboxylate transporter receptor subunit TctC